MQRYNDYIFLIEDNYISQASIMSLLDGKAEDFIALTAHPFVKYNDRGHVAFSYVGILSLNNLIICFFPKYYKRNQEAICLGEMVRILKVLKKAGSKENITPDYKNYSPFHSSDQNEFVIADYIIRDYLDNGLYTKENTYLELNQPGEINWHATIDQITPIFSKRQPIYTDTLNHVSYNASAHIITELQKFAVHELLRKYGSLLNYNFKMYEDTVSRVEDLGQQNYLTNVLTKELAQVYTDQKIQLLKLLLTFLNSRFTSENSRVYLFGTGYYHTIWERLCGHSFINQVDRYLAALPKPKWNDLAGNQVSADTFVPDMIHYSIPDKLLLILDAKYYNLALQGTATLKVSGQPGIGDISKQFLYEQALHHLGHARTLNCFLFPNLQDEPLQVSGFVSFSIFPDRKVWIVYIDPNLLLDNFLGNKVFSEVLVSQITAQIDAYTLQS